MLVVVHRGLASAIDLPRPRVELEIGKRRHRRVTGPAGLLLFICMFLPAVKGCSEPVYPVTMPMFWHPYLFGLVFAIAAASISARSLRYTVVALRILAWLTVIGAALLAVAAGAPGIVELLVGALLVGAIGTRGYSERRMALTAIAVGACSLLWFGLWAVTSDALIGVYVSTMGSAGLFAGGVLWLAELTTLREAPIGAATRGALPRAQARERG